MVAFRDNDRRVITDCFDALQFESKIEMLLLSDGNDYGLLSSKIYLHKLIFCSFYFTNRYDIS